jgi:hypothetical protein
MLCSLIHSVSYIFLPIFQYLILLSIPDRMPPQIGHLISQEVYEAKLKSNPGHPITDSIIACQFMDVKDGEEAQSGSGSWIVC